MTLLGAKKIGDGVCSVKGRRKKVDLLSEETKKEGWICSAKKRRKKTGFAQRRKEERRLDLLSDEKRRKKIGFAQRNEDRR